MINEEQEEFIKYKIDNCKLIGIPGGGKTTTIIKKIIYHIENDKYVFNNFLILTFSKFAQRDFVNKTLTLINKNKIYTRAIRTIHSLAGYLINRITTRKVSSVNTCIKVAYDLINDDKYKDTIKNILANVKVIIIDEAQDLTELYYKFVISLSKVINSYLILVGDPNQNIYQFNNCSDRYLINYDVKEFVLKTNYRSSKGIVNFINKLRPWNNKYEDMIAVNEDTNKPYIFIGNYDAIKKDIINEIKMYKKDLKHMAIIGPVKKAKPSNNGLYLNIGLQLIVNWLQTEKINYIQHYNIESEKNDDNIDKNYIDNHINLITSHSSKGLEFDKVLVINFHHTTMTKLPTKEEDNENNYLWYVTLSRAKTSMKIYVDETKTINKNIFKCIGTYDSNTIIQHEQYKYANEQKVNIFSINKIINDKKYFDDSALSYIENNFVYEQNIINLYDNNINTKDNTKYDEYSCLNGIFFEYLFMYFYDKSQFNELINRKIFILTHSISLPEEYKKCIKELGIQLFDSINVRDIEKFKNKSKIWHSFYDFVSKIKNEKIYFHIKTDVIWFENEELIKLYNNILNTDTIYKSLFKIALFEYQYDNEAGYLITDNIINCDEYIDNYKKLINNIKIYANKLTQENNNYKYQHFCSHPYIETRGYIDLIDNKNIIELKFVNEVTIKHILQVVLYYNNVNYDWTDNINFEIINLRYGKRHIFNIKPKITNYEFNIKLCEILKTKIMHPIIFYDLETTGLDTDNDYIIERYCRDYLTGWVISEGLIKPPCVISSIITEITGITNDMVKDCPDINVFKKDIYNFLQYTKQPIFIAHNGNMFDHKLMRNQNITDETVIFLDSLNSLKNIIKCDNYKLKYIHDIIVKNKTITAHRAKSDVIMMDNIYKQLNYCGFYQEANIYKLPPASFITSFTNFDKCIRKK